MIVGLYKGVAYNEKLHFKQQDEGVTGSSGSFCGRIWQSDF